jgi:hypothetical protein
MEEGMLDPWYITGLVEGEGCFSVSFNLRDSLKVGIETRASFSVSLNKRDLELLKKLHQYFSCGGIRFSKADNTYKYEVRELRSLTERVIPHFEKYPLQGSKVRDFEAFKEICTMMKANLHLSPKHMPRIIELAYSMNPSGKRKYSKDFLLQVLGGEKV